MTDALEIPLCLHPIRGAIRLPGSKSITNRALVCAALAHGESLLTGVLDSQDTRVMAAGLADLGIGIAADWPRGEIRVTGSGGTVPVAQAVIDCAASGTTIRFLSAVCAIGRGTYRLDGTPRMRKRPIGDLLQALQSLGREPGRLSARRDSFAGALGRQGQCSRQHLQPVCQRTGHGGAVHQSGDAD